MENERGARLKVSIVVPYNSKVEMTLKFLDTMQEFKPYGIDLYCILVNGGCSYDITHPFISKFVKLETNEGTTKVYNAGLKEVPEDSDYVFFVGNDSFPTNAQWLVELINLQVVTGAWIVCPANDRPGMDAYKPLYKKDCGTYWEADFFPSIAWLIPYDKFRQVGLMDEQFTRTGMWADNDYCARVKQLGGTIVVSKHILLRHLLSQESGATGTVGEDMSVNYQKYRAKWGAK